MRVLNAYVDHDHHVRMMVLGHVLLADPTPEAIGNYAAIIPRLQRGILPEDQELPGKHRI